jgi:hypothetical protein
VPDKVLSQAVVRYRYYSAVLVPVPLVGTWSSAGTVPLFIRMCYFLMKLKFI